jgi:hypothetical protein
VNKLLKALIVWLMLVAIPFQGYAAAGMLACAPAHATMAHAKMAPEHCATMGMTHAAADDAATDAATPADAGHSSPHHQAGGKCSTCASCCCVTALAPPAPLTRAPGPAAELAAFHADDGAAARVDLALPERPPKHC